MVYAENNLQWVLGEGVYAEYLNSFINQEKVIVYKGHVTLPYSHETLGYEYYLGSSSKKIDFCYLSINKNNSDVIVNKNNILIPPESSVSFNVSDVNFSSYKGLYQINISSVGALFELRVNRRVVFNNENLKKYSFNRRNFSITIKNVSDVNDLNLIDVDIVFDKDTNNRGNKVNIDVDGVPGATELFNVRANQFLTDFDYQNSDLIPINRLVNGYSLNGDVFIKPSDIEAYKSFIMNKSSVSIDLKTNFNSKNEILLIKSNDDYFNQKSLEEGQFKERLNQFNNISFDNKKLRKLNVTKMDNINYVITSVESSIVNNELLIMIILSANSHVSGFPRLKLDLEYFTTE